MPRVYLDHAATTPVRAEVLSEMSFYQAVRFGNPSSAHLEGRQAKEAVERARERVARLIGAEAEEILLTSGGTESNNAAISGAGHGGAGRRHFVTTAIEHQSVLQPFEALRRLGHEVTYLKVDRYGMVDPDDVRRALRKDTALVSVMLASNEVGTIQPVAEIGAICRDLGVLFHTDAVAAMGQVPVDVGEIQADMLSLSGHKIGGPKGAGALFVRGGEDVQPLILGGGQEGGLRGGTENVPGIVGLGKAAELALWELEQHSRQLSLLRDYLIDSVAEAIKGAKLNGHRKMRLPGNVNFSFAGADGKELLEEMDLRGVAASGGSACAAGSAKPSHVLLAMGLSEDEAKAAVRMTLGRGNDREDIERAVAVLKEIL